MMVSSISSRTYLCLSSSISVNSNPKPPIITWIAQTHFSPYNGLKHLGISISQHPLLSGNRRKLKGKGVFASLFGVGAPEALVIGVVALLVFGPKGLAEVARNLGKTLREFQPTIRELQDVSKEFKSTLEREIGLDEIRNPTQNSYNSNTTTTTPSPSSIASSEDQKTVEPSEPIADGSSLSPNKAYSTEDYLKVTEEQLKASAAQQQKQQTDSLIESQPETQTEAPDGSSLSPNKANSTEEYLFTEEQLKASAAQQQKQQTSSLVESQPETQTQTPGTVEEVAAVVPPPLEKPKGET